MFGVRRPCCQRTSEKPDGCLTAADQLQWAQESGNLCQFQKVCMPGDAISCTGTAQSLQCYQQPASLTFTPVSFLKFFPNFPIVLRVPCSAAGCWVSRSLGTGWILHTREVFAVDLELLLPHRCVSLSGPVNHRVLCYS